MLKVVQIWTIMVFMSKIHEKKGSGMIFFKYSGSGNDFIMLDNRDGSISLKAEDIKLWCSRRYGVGADGLILLQNSKSHDFAMRIFNSDGSEAEMCGNGARCSIHFFHTELSQGEKISYSFETMNGVYYGTMEERNQVRIKMTELYDVNSISVSDLSRKNSCYLNTGVPHTVIQVSHVDDVNIQSIGAAIRFDKRFSSGSNVCFFEVSNEEDQEIKLRVYERGVEDETLCCGTGVMATAVACSRFFNWFGEIKIKAKGGDLIALVGKDYKDLYFQGEVKKIFKGELIDA